MGTVAKDALTALAQKGQIAAGADRKKKAKAQADAVVEKALDSGKAMTPAQLRASAKKNPSAPPATVFADPRARDRSDQ